MRGYDSRSVLLLKRYLGRRRVRSWGPACNFLTSSHPGLDSRLLMCTLCESLNIKRKYLLYSSKCIEVEFLNGNQGWHPDSPPLEEAPMRSWWPLTSHQWKEILTVKCCQSRTAGAPSPLPSYQKHLPPSAYQDGTHTLPLICTWTVFHSWPYRGKVIDFVIHQVQPRPSLTFLLSGVEISASDVRDSKETTCWDLIWKVFRLILWETKAKYKSKVHSRNFDHNSLFQVWSNIIFDFPNLIYGFLEPNWTRPLKQKWG